jgi:CDK5 regulatory subunit-associated protein 3
MASGDSQHIPIDIHLGQLSGKWQLPATPTAPSLTVFSSSPDWLISRRHCPKDWLSNLHKIREKLAVLYPVIVAVAPVRASLEEAGVPLVASGKPLSID